MVGNALWPATTRTITANTVDNIFQTGAYMYCYYDLKVKVAAKIAAYSCKAVRFGLLTS